MIWFLNSQFLGDMSLGAKEELPISRGLRLGSALHFTLHFTQMGPFPCFSGHEHAVCPPGTLLGVHLPRGLASCLFPRSFPCPPELAQVLSPIRLLSDGARLWRHVCIASAHLLAFFASVHHIPWELARAVCVYIEGYLILIECVNKEVNKWRGWQSKGQISEPSVNSRDTLNNLLDVET